MRQTAETVPVRNASRNAREATPNFTLKLVRPGFGPAAELPASSQARRRHGGLQFATRFCERHARQPPRRAGFGARAVAAQLSVRSVMPTAAYTDFAYPERQL
jgi:hypothetical protein